MATETPATPALTLPATQLHHPLTGAKLDYSAIKRNRNRSTNVEISGQSTNKQIVDEHQDNNNNNNNNTYFYSAVRS